MTSPDWTTISTIASTVALVMGAFIWVVSKVFHLGQTSEQLNEMNRRLGNTEIDLESFKNDVDAQFRVARSEMRQDLGNTRTEISSDIQNLNHRMDKLILTIAEAGYVKQP